MSEARVRQGLTAAGTAGVAVLVVVAYALGSGGGSSAKAAPASSAPVSTVSTVSAGTSNVVTVDGTGQAAGTPDTMVTTVGVQVKEADPSAALTSASTTMALLQRTLTAHGVARKDLKTTGLSVNPVYNYANGSQTLTGYQADEQLEVTLRDLTTAGKTISAVTAAGGKDVTVDGLSLDLGSDSSLVNDARAAAYADAKAKATQYAALAQRTLGPVVSVSEHVNQAPSPVYDMRAAAAPAAGSDVPVPVQAGSQSVSVNVTIAWSLS
jgi:uncharacterized protein YggE